MKKIISGKCEIIVLTNGGEGSLILAEGNDYPIKPYSLGDLLDTTGASTGKAIAMAMVFG